MRKAVQSGFRNKGLGIGNAEPVHACMLQALAESIAQAVKVKI